MGVLVTGGAGFVGSHLTEHLLERTDEEVVVLDDFSTGARQNVSRLADRSRVTVVEGDVCDEETVADAVEDADEVYHLAAAVGVQKVVDDPIDAVERNYQGTKTVLEAVADRGVPTFFASTSEVYGKAETGAFREDDDRVIGPTTVPRWTYASSKALDESLALTYADEHDFPVVVGRLFNVVGPRQTGEYGMVVPRFVEQALRGDPLTVYGDGTQVRSFSDVEDVVEILYDLLHEPAAHGEVVNVGSTNPITINELARRVVELTDSDSEITHVPFEEAYGPDFEETDHRAADVSKLERLVGTVPRGDVERIIERILRARNDERERTEIDSQRA